MYLIDRIRRKESYFGVISMSGHPSVVEVQQLSMDTIDLPTIIFNPRKMMSGV